MKRHHRKAFWLALGATIVAVVAIHMLRTGTVL
jgi:hypothetical protein